MEMDRFLNNLSTISEAYGDLLQDLSHIHNLYVYRPPQVLFEVGYSSSDTRSYHSVPPIAMM